MLREGRRVGFFIGFGYELVWVGFVWFEFGWSRIVSVCSFFLMIVLRCFVEVGIRGL